MKKKEKGQTPHCNACVVQARAALTEVTDKACDTAMLERGSLGRAKRLLAIQHSLLGGGESAASGEGVKRVGLGKSKRHLGRCYKK